MHDPNISFYVARRWWVTDCFEMQCVRVGSTELVGPRVTINVDTCEIEMHRVGFKRSKDYWRIADELIRFALEVVGS